MGNDENRIYQKNSKDLIRIHFKMMGEDTDDDDETGQLTQNCQTDIPYCMTSCSEIKLG